MFPGSNPDAASCQLCDLRQATYPSEPLFPLLYNGDSETFFIGIRRIKYIKCLHSAWYGESIR